MRKFALIVLAFAFVFVGCAGGPSIVERTPVPADKPLYGFTKEGVFFLHKSLYDNAHGKKAIVAVESSGFVGRYLKLKGEYYVYNVKQDSGDKAAFDRFMKRRVKIQYFFPIDKGRLIPDVIKKKFDWVKEDDLFEKKRVKGVIFSTFPVENPYLKDD